MSKVDVQKMCKLINEAADCAPGFLELRLRNLASVSEINLGKMENSDFPKKWDLAEEQAKLWNSTPGVEEEKQMNSSEPFDLARAQKDLFKY